MGLLHRRVGLVVVATLAWLVSAPAAQDRPLPELEPFLEQVRARLLTFDAAQNRYAFDVTRREQSLDADGHPTDESLKVYESYPGLPGEERWERLVAEDGEPVPEERLAEQTRERQQRVRDATRRQARDPEAVRAAQAEAWEKYQRETRETIDDIFRVYDIRMLGRRSIGGYETIAFDLTPRPDADPGTDNGKQMRNFRIRAWISERDYEVVRVDAETIDVTTIWWGLLARIHAGSTISYERRLVNGEDWLPARLEYRGSARIGLVRVIRRGGSSEYSDYRKLPDGQASTASRSGAVE